MELKLREFATEDKSALVDMIGDMVLESPYYSQRIYSPDKAKNLIESLTVNGGGFLVTINDEIIGMIGGVLSEHFICMDKIALDVGLYVKPKFRGSSAAVRLIGAYEKWAFEHGAIEARLGVSTELHAEKTVCMYQKLGYTISAYGLIKQLGN